MKSRHTFRNVLLAALLAAGAAGMPAFAQVRLNPRIAPPAPLVEVVPAVATGYVWAPGYWAWLGHRYVWVRGRAIYDRPGYHWVPDYWEQRENRYHRIAGGWERDVAVRRDPDGSETPVGIGGR